MGSPGFSSFFHGFCFFRRWIASPNNEKDPELGGDVAPPAYAPTPTIEGTLATPAVPIAGTDFTTSRCCKLIPNVLTVRPNC